MAFSPNVREGKVIQWSSQMPSSAVWSVTHNLGKKPAVITIDSAGTQVFGVVKYTNNNALTVTFGSPFSGWIYLA